MEYKKLPKGFTLDKYGLHVRLVNEDDAAFIVKLRTDERLGQFIHATSPDVEQQKAWIRKYKEREAEGLEYYFIFYKEILHQISKGLSFSSFISFRLYHSV